MHFTGKFNGKPVNVFYNYGPPITASRLPHFVRRLVLPGNYDAVRNSICAGTHALIHFSDSDTFTTQDAATFKGMTAETLRPDFMTMLDTEREPFMEEARRIGDVIRANAMRDAMWWRRQRIIVDLARKLDDQPRIDLYTYQMRSLRELTRWEIQRRMEEAKRATRLRIMLDDIIGQHHAALAGEER
jgi:hypothetical protein